MLIKRRCKLTSKIHNKNISELNLSESGISFKFMGNLVVIDPARFSDPYAVFFDEEYGYLDVKDKDVIDIGMNIGDSTIYFSLRGAKRIIGVEPYPYSFSFAEKNVRLNNIRNATLLNAGYGKDSNINVDLRKVSSSGSVLSQSDNGKEIPYLFSFVFNYFHQLS